MSPSRTAIAALRMATETTVAEARKVRRWAPAVWSTNRSVPPLRTTLMSCPQTLVADANDDDREQDQHQRDAEVVLSREHVAALLAA